MITVGEINVEISGIEAAKSAERCAGAGKTNEIRRATAVFLFFSQCLRGSWVPESRFYIHYDEAPLQN